MFRRAGVMVVVLWNRSSQLSFRQPFTYLNKCIAAQKKYQHNTSASSTIMSSSDVAEKDLKYQDIVKLIKEKSILLIDVREPQEIKDNGILPDSVNIPLNEVKEVLSNSSSAEFVKEYGIPLPEKDTCIVFSCHAGGRSKKALLTALELGYRNAKHYAGGFSDWKNNTASH